MSGAKFNPGAVVATPGVLEAFTASGQSPLEFLQRHLAGDWGEVDENDVRENELSLQHGWRILSAYRLSTGVKFDHHGSRQKRDDIPAAGRILTDRKFSPFGLPPAGLFFWLLLCRIGRSLPLAE